MLQTDLERLEADLEGMRSQKASLEEAMKRRERVAALLDKRDHLDRLIAEIDTRRAANRLNCGRRWHMHGVPS